MIIIKLLGSIKILVKYPMIVRVDNVSVIFMACNIITKSCMEHVDIRYEYVNEYVEDGIVKVVFKSADNDSDILTKN